MAAYVLAMTVLGLANIDITILVVAVLLARRGIARVHVVALIGLSTLSVWGVNLTVAQFCARWVEAKFGADTGAPRPIIIFLIAAALAWWAWTTWRGGRSRGEEILTSIIDASADWVARRVWAVPAVAFLSAVLICVDPAALAAYAASTDQTTLARVIGFAVFAAVTTSPALVGYAAMRTTIGTTAPSHTAATSDTVADSGTVPGGDTAALHRRIAQRVSNQRVRRVGAALAATTSIGLTVWAVVILASASAG